jgi:hypothetical protein
VRKGEGRIVNVNNSSRGGGRNVGIKKEEERKREKWMEMEHIDFGTFSFF